ncbi:MAG TPA: PEGA domain-containing protein [Candidatus Polarisedimenticolia bacterium]|jgi:hypothetical protein
MTKRIALTGIRALLAAGLCLLPAAAADAHSIRGHSTHRSPRVSIRVGGFYGYGYSYWNSPYYGYYGYYPGYPAYYGGPGYLPDVGFIDTDIQPEETAVYVDGEYAGTVDDFDGFPDYLSIPTGRHTLTFKADGYRSVSRSVRVPRGGVLSMDFSLTRGSGNEEPAPRDERGEPTAPRSDAEGRTSRPRGEVQMEGEEGAEEGEAEPGLIRLNVTPTDASVYMDGEFLGTASRVSRLHGDLRLAPGEHRIEVVRPGYVSISRSVKVASGDRRTLDLALERSEGAEPR